MAVDTTKLTKGDTLKFNTKFKEYEPGTLCNFDMVIPVQGKPMAMVSVAGARPFAVPTDKLDLATVPAAAEEEDSIEGPVLDFFNTHANLDSEMAINFASKYIEMFGKEDVSFVSQLIEQEGLKVGQGWTIEQTARLADNFYNTFGMDVDPLVVKALEEAAAPPVMQKPATPVAAQAEATPVKPRAKKIADAPVVGVVDKAGWDGKYIGAMRIAADLLRHYSESPDTFNDELKLACEMLAAKVK
jgi:hypothetical protein